MTLKVIQEKPRKAYFSRRRPPGSTEALLTDMVDAHICSHLQAGGPFVLITGYICT
jgi:hypothetical protein